MVAANKFTSIAGHFDGHGGAPVRYGMHRPMQHDQGFTESHWTPPLGNYSLRIALAAARRMTINKTTMQNVPTLLAVSMAIAMPNGGGLWLSLGGPYKKISIFLNCPRTNSEESYLIHSNNSQYNPCKVSLEIMTTLSPMDLPK